MYKAFEVLLANELRTLLRTRATMFWIVIFPFFFLAMMLLSYGKQGTLGSVTVELVDNDHSDLSEEYIQLVRAAFTSAGAVSGKIVWTNQAVPVAEGAVRVTLPEGFAAAVQRNETVPVAVEYHFAGGLATQIAARIFQTLTVRFNAQIGGAPMPVRVNLANAGTSRPISFAHYVLTGVLVLSMMAAGMNSTCVSIADRRERNTFKVMSCLPLWPGVYLAAMLASRMVVLCAAALLLLLGGRYLFSIPLELDASRLFGTAAVIGLGGLMLLSMGIAMSSRLSSVPSANFITNLVYISLMFLSDLTMPLNSLPADMRSTFSLLPTSQFVDALRHVLVSGESIVQHANSVLTMLGWTGLFLVVARALFHWHRQ
jgi:ABC-2 type transport system permease protein